jgi:hypothetical protein
MAEASEILEHPVFGSLGWLPDFDHWYTQYRRPNGHWLDVIVYPDDPDRYAAVEAAARLFPWALKNEQFILQDAMQAELLELYNDIWRGEDEPELTADELTARLDWQLVVIKTGRMSRFPVEFNYEAGYLFGYHGVTVKVDEKLAFHDIELRG